MLNEVEIKDECIVLPVLSGGASGQAGRTLSAHYPAARLSHYWTLFCTRMVSEDLSFSVLIYPLLCIVASASQTTNNDNNCCHQSSARPPEPIA